MLFAARVTTFQDGVVVFLRGLLSPSKVLSLSLHQLMNVVLLFMVVVASPASSDHNDVLVGGVTLLTFMLLNVHGGGMTY